MINFDSWTQATANLSWGAQAAMHDALSLVAEGKVTLAYGSDYVDGKPCLVNSVGQMLEVGGGNGIPSANFSQVVGEFDKINRDLFEKNVNTKYNFVSPLAAEILLANFGPLKGTPEASDDEFAANWLEAIKSDAPAEDHEPLNARDLIDLPADVDADK